MKKKINLILMALIPFISCDESPTADRMKLHLDSVLAEREYQRETEFFVVPDSINTSLIVATFYECGDQSAHALIVYNDTNRRAATKIKFLADSTVQTDPLAVTKFNEFISTANKGEYIIKENTVVYQYINFNSGASLEYKRTDKNSY